MRNIFDNNMFKMLGIFITVLLMAANLLVTINGWSYRASEANNYALKVEINGIKEHLSGMNASIISLNESIHGNGHEGLKSDVAIIKSELSNIKKDLQYIKGRIPQ